MEAEPQLPRGLLSHSWDPQWQAKTTALGCVSIHLNHTVLTAERVTELKSTGLRILVYTVNSPDRARTLLRWGVDAICTDAIDIIGPDFN